MASKKKFEGYEVSVTAPRMSKFEEGLYDRAQMTPEQRRQEAIDMALGFAGGPIAGVTRAEAQAARQASGYLKSVQALKDKAAANAKSLAGSNTRPVRKTLDTLGQPLSSKKEYLRQLDRSYSEEGRNIKPSLDDYDMASFDDYAKGGKVKAARYAKGGMVKSRDGIAKRGITKGRMR